MERVVAFSLPNQANGQHLAANHYRGVDTNSACSSQEKNQPAFTVTPERGLFTYAAVDVLHEVRDNLAKISRSHEAHWDAAMQAKDARNDLRSITRESSMTSSVAPRYYAFSSGAGIGKPWSLHNAVEFYSGRSSGICIP